MDILRSTVDYPPYVKQILRIIEKPEVLKEYDCKPVAFKVKSRALKKAVTDIKHNRCTMTCTEWRAGNGDLMFFVIYDHSPKFKRTAFTGGVVVAKYLKEIPFKNVIERKEAVEKAMAIYHYARSFKEYGCSAGK